MKFKKLIAYKRAIESLRKSSFIVVYSGKFRYEFERRFGKTPTIQFGINPDPKKTIVFNNKYKLMIAEINEHDEYVGLNNPEIMPFDIVAYCLDSYFSVVDARPNHFGDLDHFGELVKIEITHANPGPFAPGRFPELILEAHKIAEESKSRGVTGYSLILDVERGIFQHETLKPYQSIKVISNQEKWSVCIQTNDYYGGITDIIYEIDRDDENRFEPEVVV